RAAGVRRHLGGDPRPRCRRGPGRRPRRRGGPAPAGPHHRYRRRPSGPVPHTRRRPGSQRGGSVTARYSLLALAHPRAGWFREVARWASSAALPAEYTVCVTHAQAVAHLGTDQPFSALLVDAAVVGVDRDLLQA